MFQMLKITLVSLLNKVSSRTLDNAFFVLALKLWTGSLPCPVCWRVPWRVPNHLTYFVYLEMAKDHLSQGDPMVRWFWHLVRIPTGHLPGKVFWACPTRRKPQGRPRTCFGDDVSWLACVLLEVSWKSW